MTEIDAEYCLWFEILELVKEREAVLKKIIPKKKRISLRIALREIKKAVAKKFQENFYCPPIQIFSKESQIEK